MLFVVVNHQPGTLSANDPGCDLHLCMLDKQDQYQDLINISKLVMQGDVMNFFLLLTLGLHVY